MTPEKDPKDVIATAMTMITTTEPIIENRGQGHDPSKHKHQSRHH